MNVLIKVYGHPRSGNNLLITYMYKNFYDGRDFGGDSGKIGHWSDKKNTRGNYTRLDGKKADLNPYAKIFGGHGFKPSGKIKNSIYIIRDGRDVVYSLWNSRFTLSKKEKNMSFPEYIRTKIDWLGTPGKRYIRKPIYTPIEHWQHHVENWMKSDIIITTYENLVSQPETVIRKIGKKFNLDLINDKIATIKKKVGWKPNRGRKGTWKEVYTDKDLEFIYSKVPRSYKWFMDDG